MNERTRLEELSSALPNEERRQLLERIVKRLGKHEGDEVVAMELEDDERESIVESELKQASRWVRFLVWLGSYFSGKGKRDVFVAIKLRTLKRRIRQTSPGLTGFETRDLSPRFARALYDLYTALHPLIDCYRGLTEDRSLRGNAFRFLVESQYPRARRSLGEFITDAEMERIFATTADVEQIRTKLVQKLNDYSREIPEELFTRLEDGAVLHVYLGRLALFPFASIFRYFNYLLAGEPEGKYPAFSHAPAMLMLDQLERLLFLLSLFRNCQVDEPTFLEEPIAFYFRVRQEAPPSDGTDSTPVDVEVAKARGQILQLLKEVGRFDRAIPLFDLIKYFRRDPYYNLFLTPPRLHLKSLYLTSLKGRLLEELTQRLDTIKARVLAEQVEATLRGQRAHRFSYYSDNPGFDFRALGLPIFAHTRSLDFLVNFIAWQYKKHVKEALPIVNMYALANNRPTQNRLLKLATDLEELEEDILRFDHSLSPEEHDGKQSSRLRQTIASDLVHQRAYRTFVAQKDREAMDLIRKGTAQLGGIMQTLDEIRASTAESTKDSLKTLHVYRGKNLTLLQIVSGRAEAIRGFLNTLDQLVMLERGV